LISFNRRFFHSPFVWLVPIRADKIGGDMMSKHFTALRHGFQAFQLDPINLFLTCSQIQISSLPDIFSKKGSLYQAAVEHLSWIGNSR
jgi:hypothetical protein